VPNLEPVTQQRSQRRLSWDVVRVVAIYGVVIQHITHQAPINHPELGPYPFVLPLQYGASTLIVISAYFVCVTVRRGNTGQWLWNRVARLLPAYLVAVLLTYVVSRIAASSFNHLTFANRGGLLFGNPIAASGPAPWYLPNGTDLVSNLLMVQAWAPRFHWLDASYWTLPVQLMAFSTAALLWRKGWWTNRRLFVLLWSLIVVPLVIRFLWRSDDAAQWIKSTFDGLALHRVALFGAGIAIWLWTKKRMSGWQLGGYLIAVLAAQDAHAYFSDTRSTIAFGVVLAGIVAAAGGPDWNVGILRPLAPVITWLGGISYGVYLVHQELGFVLAEAMVDVGIGPWLRIVACTAMAVGLGWLMTRLVERPVHRWLTQPQAGSAGTSPVKPAPVLRPANHAIMSAAGPLTSPEPVLSGMISRHPR
jgi:peptidoglycan/LPS O-acetylase OafA/YrhL